MPLPSRKPTIENVVRADYSFWSSNTRIHEIVAAFDQSADIVNAFARHRAVYERKRQVHAVLFNTTKVVVVEPGPRPEGNDSSLTRWRRAGKPAARRVAQSADLYPAFGSSEFLTLDLTCSVGSELGTIATPRGLTKDPSPRAISVCSCVAD